MKHGIGLGLLGIFSLFTIQSHVLAGGTVTSCDEASLRAAMAGGGTVTFACDGTIVLANTLVITNDTSIDATGQSLSISGNHIVRVFHIESGATLKLQNLTVRNGFAGGTDGAVGVSGESGMGGAVLLSDGVFDATGCFFQSNHVYGGNGGAAGTFQPGGAGGIGAGGVVYNAGGLVYFTGCTFQGNQALGGDGGAGSGTDSSQPAGIGGAGWAGALYCFGGQAFLTNCIFVENFSQGGKGGPGFGSLSALGGNAGGGAVVASNAMVQLVGCDVRQNQCVGGRGRRGGGTATWESGVAQGGGLLFTNGNFFASGCRFNSNVVQLIGGSNPAEGGAIWGSGVAGRISDSLFRDNTALGGAGLIYGTPFGQPGGRASGGGVYLGPGGTLAITNATFDHNSTLGGEQTSGNYPGAGAGGGIYNLGGLTMANCTFDHNIAQAGDNGGAQSTSIQGGAFGGSIYNQGGTVVLESLSIVSGAAISSPTNASGFQAVARGGGLFSTNGSVSMHNTLIAYSSAGSNCFGTITDLGHNLSSDASAGFSAVGSLNNTDPKLGPLSFYGGFTPTMPLLAGSPAIDGGDSVAFPPSDQRGHARPYVAAADIGAFESSPPYVIRGAVTGATLDEEVGVVTSTTNVLTVNHGSYSLEGLVAGTYSVVPTSSNFLFQPTNRVIPVGPDQLNVDFKAYRWNALSLESAANGVLHLAFAGTNGLSYRMLASSNLVDWFPVSTNSTGTSNLFEFFDAAMQSNPTRFYRAVSP